MKQPEEPIRSQVASWLAKADDDYQLIERLAAEADEFPAIVAFHSQQVSEKYLKALLVVHQIDFPKTHDIKQLLALLRPAEPEAAAQLADARWLTPFGAAMRYPGDYPELHPGDAQRAIETARRVRAVVLEVLARYFA